MAGLLDYPSLTSALGLVASGFNAPPGAQDANLSVVQRGFLGLMRAAESAGAADTSLKLYNDIIQRGRRQPITNADFTPDQLASIQKMVDAKIASTGRPSGHIDYADYPGGNLQVADRSKAAGEIMNTLGGFNYSIDQNGGTNITDTYDFNKNRGDASDNSLWAQLLGATFAPRNLAASIGRRVLPDTGSQGVPVSLNLPPQQQ